MTPNFQYTPQYRLKGDDKVVQIGDRSLSVASTGQTYPGWDQFKPIVLEVFRAAIETELLGEPERVSAKYVNVLPVAEGKGLQDLTRVKIELGGLSVSEESYQLRVEVPNGNLITIVGIAFPGSVITPKGETKGIVLDIDSIVSKAADGGWADIETQLEEAHAEEKRVFFDLLSESSIEQFEAKYD
jgi:uncharacterized protein (TIGR04255 family)